MLEEDEPVLLVRTDLKVGAPQGNVGHTPNSSFVSTSSAVSDVSGDGPLTVGRSGRDPILLYRSSRRHMPGGVDFSQFDEPDESFLPSGSVRSNATLIAATQKAADEAAKKNTLPDQTLAVPATKPRIDSIFQMEDDDDV